MSFALVYISSKDGSATAVIKRDLQPHLYKEMHFEEYFSYAHFRCIDSLMSHWEATPVLLALDLVTFKLGFERG
ncbi:hypothetical protein TNCV_2463771 [Trichonephila clavipes]|nr:hypothetical protein TNCV_2463771 [Trichonephila clavipes]